MASLVHKFNLRCFGLGQRSPNNSPRTGIELRSDYIQPTQWWARYSKFALSDTDTRYIEIGLKRYRYTILWKVAKAISISIQKYRAIRIADTCISILPISVYYVTVKFVSAIRKIWVKRYRYTILWKVAKAIPISIQKYRAIRIADTCISILPISEPTT